MDRTAIVIPEFRKFRKNLYAGTLLTLDPGGTTGWSLWKDAKRIDSGQLDTSNLDACAPHLVDWVLMHARWLGLDIGDRHLAPFKVVMEDYRIYGFKTEDHAWSQVHTIQLIGMFKYVFATNKIGYELVMAGHAKSFADDDKLEAWGHWIKGQKHARDAIRHALTWYCTPPK